MKPRNILPGCILVSLVALAYFTIFLRYGINLDDEGTLLYQIYRASLGQVPYLDFHVGYTPGIYYFNALMFHLFGVGVDSIRIALALFNSLSLFCLAYLIGKATSTRAALFIPLVYVSFIPLHVSEFCSFNIPYPGWYVTFFWLLATIGLSKYAASYRLGWLVLCGALTGLTFFFKPNAGLFQLAGVAFYLLMLSHPLRGAETAGRWWRRSHTMAWWALLAGATGGLILIFSQGASMREIKLFLSPVLVFVLLLALCGGRRFSESPGKRGTDTRHLLVSSSAVGVGVLVITTPWVAYLLHKIGTERFLAQVLLIGASFEDFYFTPHRVLGSGDLALTIGVAVISAAGLAIQRGKLRSWPLLSGLAMASIAGLALLSWQSVMPDGFNAAVVSRLKDMSFGMVQIVHWSAIGTLALSLYQGHQLASPRQQSFALLTLTGMLMYLQAYPRTDFMHLIMAVPATVAVGAVLVDRVATLWAASSKRFGASAVRAMFFLPFAALALFRIAPSLGALFEINQSGAFISQRPQAYLGLQRAPVHLEAGRSRGFQELRAVVKHLETVTAPDESVFTFPVLDLVTFLAGRENISRHGYFFPGWPGHDVEAEVVSDLALKKPRYVVCLERHTLFFFHAAAYYYMIHDFLARNYVVDSEFGSYTVLRRKDLPPTLQRLVWHALPWTTELPRPLAAELAKQLASADEQVELNVLARLAGFAIEEQYKPLLAKLASPQASVRNAAVWALRKTSSPKAAAALAAGVYEGSFSPAMTLLALRVVSALGDLEAAANLVEFADESAGPEHDTAVNILGTAGSKWQTERFWFGKRQRRKAAAKAIANPIIAKHALQWLADPVEDWRLRQFSAAVAGTLPLAQSKVPLLIALGSSYPSIVEASAWTLADLGYEEIPLRPLLSQLDPHDPSAAPLIVKLFRENPNFVRPALLQALQTPRHLDKVHLTWLAGLLADPVFEKAILRLAVDDYAKARVAAAWALGSYRTAAAGTALQALAEDESYQVRDMAKRSLAKLRAAEGN